MTRYLRVLAELDIPVADDLTPAQRSALILGVEVDWSGYPDGAAVRVHPVRDGQISALRCPNRIEVAA